jgi:hypothetical protein
MPRQPAKSKACKACGNPFSPMNSLQKVCPTVACATQWARAQAAKEGARKQLMLRSQRAAEKRATRVRLMSRRDWIKRVQVVFNRFVRLRDLDQLCICCDQPLTLGAGVSTGGGTCDAGHYRSVGSAPHLRFNEDNCHAQRKQCNQFGAGRAVDYRLGLIRRIGLARVEALEADQSSPKWSIDELKALEATYKAKVKELEARS